VRGRKERGDCDDEGERKAWKKSGVVVLSPVGGGGSSRTATALTISTVDEASKPEGNERKFGLRWEAMLLLSALSLVLARSTP
jgi:hypothetical protein